MFTFHDLEMRYGSPTAYHILVEIEKAARISSEQRMVSDPETRLANACRIQDERRQSAFADLSAIARSATAEASARQGMAA